jgi:hypothetical protein
MVISLLFEALKSDHYETKYETCFGGRFFYYRKKVILTMAKNLKPLTKPAKTLKPAVPVYKESAMVPAKKATALNVLTNGKNKAPLKQLTNKAPKLSGGKFKTFVGK